MTIYTVHSLSLNEAFNAIISFSENSVGLSSDEEFKRFLDQSNSENESRVPSDSTYGVSEHAPNFDGVGGKVTNHEESVADDRHEILLIDLREPSSERERGGSSSNRGQVTVEKGQKESSGDMRQRSPTNDHRRLSDETRERPSSSRKQSSLNLRGESSGGGRAPSTDGHEPSEDNRKPSTNNHEQSGKHREPSDDCRNRLKGNRQQLNNFPSKASVNKQREQRSNLEERTSTYRFVSNSHSRPERASDDRRDIWLEGESRTKTSRTNSKSHGVETQTRDLISPRSSATSMTSTSTRDVDNRDWHGRNDEYRIPDRRIPDRRIPDRRISDRRIPDRRIPDTG